MTLTLCDVGPRDGLQNEPDVLAPEVRAELVNRLAGAGLPRVEAASFVRADRVPQMAGAEEVVRAIERRDDVGGADRMHDTGQLDDGDVGPGSDRDEGGGEGQRAEAPLDPDGHAEV